MINAFGYADVKCPFLHTYGGLKASIIELTTEPVEIGLKIIRFSNEFRINIISNKYLMLDKEQAVEVNEFQYLGNMIVEDGSAVLDINSRVTKENNIFFHLTNVKQSGSHLNNTKFRKSLSNVILCYIHHQYILMCLYNSKYVLESIRSKQKNINY